jgi:asparagine synthase (glutamine-hydrolysing)
MNAKLLFKTIFLIIMLLLLVMIGLNNRGPVSFSLPPGFKLEAGVGKRVFKSMAGPMIPEELITRPKMGFVAPVDEWMRTSLRTEFESTVLAPEMERYFQLKEVRRLWQEHQRGTSNHRRKLWTMLMLACWDRRHRR